MLKRPNDSELSTQGESLPGDASVVTATIASVPPTASSVSKPNVSQASVDSDVESEDDDPLPARHWLDGDTKSFLISLGVHVGLILGLASIPILSSPESLAVLLQSVPVVEEEPEFNVVEEIAYSDNTSESIGANSFGGTGMALSEASLVADVSEIPAMDASSLNVNPNFEISTDVKQAVGMVDSNRSVRGMTGVGTTGTEGAVDRITYEILKSIEERPTLVVWLFDASGSLTRRRQEIRDRFDKIYEELGSSKGNETRRSLAKNWRRFLSSPASFLLVRRSIC